MAQIVGFLVLLLWRFVAADHPIVTINRHHKGDLFYTGGETCPDDLCVGSSSGTAGAAEGNSCSCQCLVHLPVFREDLDICVNDIHECSLASFKSGSSSQKIPFVFLPLKGQIVHPSAEISFAEFSEDGKELQQAPICVVSNAQFLTRGGWVELRNTSDTEPPFRLFRDEGRTFLQWLGEVDLRLSMEGRVMLVHMLCKDTTRHDRPIFQPCVSFRVAGRPNVREVIFPSDVLSSASGGGLSVSEYVAIGVCTILLGLIYVASVFLYLHVRKRRRKKQDEVDQSHLTVAEEGIVKNNPLLRREFESRSHGKENPGYANDNVNCDVNDEPPEIVITEEPRVMQKTSMRQVTAADVHPCSLHEHHCLESLQESSSIERLPEENVSIVETMDPRTTCMGAEEEEKPDPLRAMVSMNGRRKLYFNPAYFEPELLHAPPPAAIEFLTKIREVIAIAKHKMSSKRYLPSLMGIPEDEAEEEPIGSSAESAAATANTSRDVSLSYEQHNVKRGTFSKQDSSQETDIYSNKPLQGCTKNICPSNCSCRYGQHTCSNVRELRQQFVEDVYQTCRACSLAKTEHKQLIIRKWLEEVEVVSVEGKIEEAVEPDVEASKESPATLGASPKVQKASSDEGSKKMTKSRKKKRAPTAPGMVPTPNNNNARTDSVAAATELKEVREKDLNICEDANLETSSNSSYREKVINEDSVSSCAKHPVAKSLSTPPGNATKKDVDDDQERTSSLKKKNAEDKEEELVLPAAAKELMDKVIMELVRQRGLEKAKAESLQSKRTGSKPVPPTRIDSLANKISQNLEELAKNIEASSTDNEVRSDDQNTRNEAKTGNGHDYYEADSLEKSQDKGPSTPSDYADLSDIEKSITKSIDNLSQSLPMEEELTMRNTIYNMETGNVTISKMKLSNSAPSSKLNDLDSKNRHLMPVTRNDQLPLTMNNIANIKNKHEVKPKPPVEDDHDYEIILLTPEPPIEPTKKDEIKLYCLPELLNSSDGYNLVSEVYVNDDYNFSDNSASNSPHNTCRTNANNNTSSSGVCGSSSNDPSMSSASSTSSKIRYPDSREKLGRLTIEVKDSPENYQYLPDDSDSFEPDTLDRKSLKIRRNESYVDSLERPLKWSLWNRGSFRDDSLERAKQEVEAFSALSPLARTFGSLREIYEARSRRRAHLERKCPHLCEGSTGSLGSTHSVSSDTNSCNASVISDATSTLSWKRGSVNCDAEGRTAADAKLAKRQRCPTPPGRPVQEVKPPPPPPIMPVTNFESKPPRPPKSSSLQKTPANTPDGHSRPGTPKNKASISPPKDPSPPLPPRNAKPPLPFKATNGPELPPKNGVTRSTSQRRMGLDGFEAARRPLPPLPSNSDTESLPKRPNLTRRSSEASDISRKQGRGTPTSQTKEGSVTSSSSISYDPETLSTLSSASVDSLNSTDYEDFYELLPFSMEDDDPEGSQTLGRTLEKSLLNSFKFNTLSSNSSTMSSRRPSEAGSVINGEFILQAPSVGNSLTEQALHNFLHNIHMPTPSVLERIAAVEKMAVNGDGDNDGLTKGMQIALNLRKRVGKDLVKHLQDRSGSDTIKKTWRKLIERVEESWSDAESKKSSSSASGTRKHHKSNTCIHQQKPDDSGYLSTDSNESFIEKVGFANNISNKIKNLSKAFEERKKSSNADVPPPLPEKPKFLQKPNLNALIKFPPPPSKTSQVNDDQTDEGQCTQSEGETDESLYEGCSESGAESVATDSFFGSFPACHASKDHRVVLNPKLLPQKEECHRRFKDTASIAEMTESADSGHGSDMSTSNGGDGCCCGTSRPCNRTSVGPRTGRGKQKAILFEKIPEDVNASGSDSENVSFVTVLPLGSNRRGFVVPPS